MHNLEPATVTQLLRGWARGEQDRLHELLPLVQNELHRIAQGHMRAERSGHTLQTTALVNEAYLRLVGGEQPTWQNRAHFFGIAARIMRQILVDHARGVRRDKRGGGAQLLPLDETLVFSPSKSASLLALDEALDRLALRSERHARVVELRYFGGLSVRETAAVLQVHVNTVLRDWTLAKAWLKGELDERK